MSKILIIVESPTKAIKFQSYLPKDKYIVKASMGHIRGISNKGLGIDINNDFKPEYIITKPDQVKMLKSAFKQCNEIILASDNDREGESIAWHICRVLNVTKAKRIIFNDTTKKTFMKALENPTKINQNLVNSQQGRSVLDKLVGWDLSPLLWDKNNIQSNKNGLSAGRVQSVTTKLVKERQDEIEKFSSNKYFKIDALFDNDINGTLNNYLPSENETNDFLIFSKEFKYIISNIEKKESKKYPSPPFETSSLQKELGRKFNLSSKQIMSIAQSLYEKGLITYHRTDSIFISDTMLKNISNFISEKYGDKYLNPKQYQGKDKNAQEAHECIRPTSLNPDSNDIKNLSDIEKKVYDIIWKRTVASQMSPQISNIIIVKIGVIHNEKLSEKYWYICKGEKVKFDGFKLIYNYQNIDTDSDNNSDSESNNYKVLNSLNVNDYIKHKYVKATEKYSQPPNKYTEADLLSKMKKLGIGRPSTYATIIQKIQDKTYVEKVNKKGEKKDIKVFILKDNIISENKSSITVNAEKNKLNITSLGKKITEFLENNFSQIMDYGYTGKIENELDEIARGNKDWKKVIKNFYKDYHPKVEELNMQKNNNSNSGVSNNSNNLNKKLLFTDEETGYKIFTYEAKFGSVIQIGEAKPKFISIEENPSDMTEEIARNYMQYPKILGQYMGLDIILNRKKNNYSLMFDNQYISIDYDDIEEETNTIIKKYLPSILGKHNDKNVLLKNGRYGKYIVYDGRNYSIRDCDNLTFDEICTKIDDYDNKPKVKLIKELTSRSKEGNIKIYEGQYGPYFIYSDILYGVPKEYDPEKLTIKDCKEIAKAKNNKK